MINYSKLNRFIYTKFIYPTLFFALRLDVKTSWNLLSEIIEDKPKLEGHIKNKIIELTNSDCGSSLADVERKLFQMSVLTKFDYSKKSKEINYKGLIKRQTSGSSGTPNTFFYTKECISNQMAVRKYAYRKMGIDIGFKEARFWNSKNINIKSKIQNAILNRSVFTFLDNEMEQISKFKRMNADYIYGYSSLILNSIAVFKKHKILPPPVKAIICTAEAVTDFQIEQISQFYNAPVAVEYGCTEFDIVAYKFGSKPYKIINPNILIENLGNKSVITALDNTKLKLIRYDVGDEIAFELDKKYYIAGDNITELLGRTQNRIVKLDDGREFHASEFSKLMSTINNNIFPIHLFKVVLKNGGIIDFNIEPQDPSDSTDQNKALVVTYLKEGLPTGLTPVVKFQSIDLNSDGKHSYFSTEMQS
ncbi:hypothetical protein [Alkalimarinus alittae]|uniref:Phenylacetate-CoA ligase n=1 Tax=Alkalimarinus alittae TaxID=2961619 RepID=A0ABY6N7M8_9ALTE|nr:hypothetical protein [Alkalimarinus alittae]UZE97972.1 hypothetical protein NKI27_09630 [Alkalimarinus alittae]